MTKELQKKMVARRVKKGNNELQSWRLLREHMKNHGGDNLAYALVYDGYATEKQAYKFIAELQKMQPVPHHLRGF